MSVLQNDDYSEDIYIIYLPCFAFQFHSPSGLWNRRFFQPGGNKPHFHNPPTPLSGGTQRKSRRPNILRD